MILILLLLLLIFIIIVLLLILLPLCFAHGAVAIVHIMIVGVIQRSSCTGQPLLLEHILTVSAQEVCHLCDLMVRARLVNQPAGAPGHIATLCCRCRTLPCSEDSTDGTACCVISRSIVP